MRSLAAVGFLLSLWCLSAAQVRPFKLMVGDSAPSLAVSKWMRGGPISVLDQKGIYAVEFWAHWCPYCRRAMPHMGEMAKQFGEKVTFIGVELEDPHPEEVPAFLAGRSDMRYPIGLDDCPPVPDMPDRHEARQWALHHGETAKAWFVDSGFDKIGIPQLAIIVDGRIAWFGQPDVADEPLAKIVGGTFDFKAEIARYSAEKSVFKKGIPLRDDLKAKIAKKDWSGALALCNDLLALDPVVFSNHVTDKVDALLHLNQPEAAYSFVRDSMKAVKGTADEADYLNSFAYSIVEQAPNLSLKDFDLAIAAATRATEVAKFKPGFIFDTLAAAYLASGNKVMAIESEKRAYLECEDEEKADFRKTLKLLLASR